MNGLTLLALLLVSLQASVNDPVHTLELIEDGLESIQMTEWGPWDGTPFLRQ